MYIYIYTERDTEKNRKTERVRHTEIGESARDIVEPILGSWGRDRGNQVES